MKQVSIVSFNLDRSKDLSLLSAVTLILQKRTNYEVLPRVCFRERHELGKLQSNKHTVMVLRGRPGN